ncbi:hypothetical protein DXX93_09500 [Thalassotalea euphylliae]|uniref:Uncharacterized protein n=1 Tax=Thalassotalea euphylliae TaxID=1655234 RepID=A0A3E0TQB8_9GAMM|nr:hypothetical protein [Thalassotalea euphylliae]REL26786.1 hypothetical protein DXX93_09500 [Thalassotalea euphylliae]
MEILTNQAYLHQPKRSFREKDNKLAPNDSPLQPKIAEPENKGIKLTLSSNAFSMLRLDQKSNNKADEQKRVEYEAAQEKYQESVNELPNDYRKMKVLKDSIEEEIKKIEKEIREVKQSSTLDEEEKKQVIRSLEQQLADKSLAALDIRKEFTQKLKEQERSKQISPEAATAMLKVFISSPPEAPQEDL